MRTISKALSFPGGKRSCIRGHAALIPNRCGKEVFYALDDAEKDGRLEYIRAEKIRGNVNVQRFKGLGEMNPPQLRETTMAKETRRLVKLTLDSGKSADNMLDMLLSKKRASDRKTWLESKGDLLTIEV